MATSRVQHHFKKKKQQKPKIDQPCFLDTVFLTIDPLTRTHYLVKDKRMKFFCFGNCQTCDPEKKLQCPYDKEACCKKACSGCEADFCPMRDLMVNISSGEEEQQEEEESIA